MLTAWANIPGHIFHDTQHFNPSFIAEINFLPYIEEGDFLWGGYDEGAGEAAFF